MNLNIELQWFLTLNEFKNISFDKANYWRHILPPHPPGLQMCKQVSHSRPLAGDFRGVTRTWLKNWWSAVERIHPLMLHTRFSEVVFACWPVGSPSFSLLSRGFLKMICGLLLMDGVTEPVFGPVHWTEQDVWRVHLLAVYRNLSLIQ